MMPEHQHQQQQQQQQHPPHQHQHHQPERLPTPDEDEEEQVPSPRSVAMTSITRAFTSTTVQAAASSHRHFHKPFLGKQRSWPLTEEDYRSTTSTTTTTWHTSTTSSSSRMNDATTECPTKRLTWKDLHPLPAYAELRLHLHLTTLPLETVLSRILRWMRLQSICYKSRLENESYLDGSWTTLCQTSNSPRRVHFVVYLWRVDPEQKNNPQDHDDNNGSDNKNDPKEGSAAQTIAVQLDRRSGCAVLTQRLRRCLYHYLQQPQPQQNQETLLLRVQQEQEQQLQRVVCARIKRLLDDKENQEHVASDQPASETTTMTTTSFRPHGRYHCETMARCLSLLNSDCRDERQMGLESLVCLTDPSVTTRKTVEQIAEALILECRPRSNQFRFIRLHVLSYVQKGKKRQHQNHSHGLPTAPLNHRQNDGSNKNNDDDDDDLSVAAFTEENHAAVMHSLALKVVSNALQMLVNSKTNSSSQPAILEQPQSALLEHSNVWCTVVCSLARDIKDVAQCPQDAAFAAKCLFLLSNLFPDAAVNLLMVKDKLMPHLLMAQTYGEERHCVLEQEVRNLIVQMGGVPNS
jgi:hypothetical protein